MKKVVVLLGAVTFVFGLTGYAMATAIPVPNFSFEDPALGYDGDYTNSIADWDQDGGSSGVYSTTSNLSGFLGDNVAYINGPGLIGQYLTGQLLAANTTYTLEVAVGNRSDVVFFPTYMIILGAGNPSVSGSFVTLAWDNTASPAAGAFADSTVTYTALAGDPSLGLTLGIQLQGYGGGQVNFDNVRLTTESSSVAPEPTTLFLLGSGLIGLAGLGRKKFGQKK